MGLTFDTEPGLMGDVYQVQPLKELCPPGTQPSDDLCGQSLDGGATGGGGASGSGGKTGAGGASSTGGKTGTGGANDAGPMDASNTG